MIAKKTQQYKKLRESRELQESREQAEQDVLNESSVSQSSKSTYSKPGSRISSAKKTFVTGIKNHYKPQEAVSIYKPNISCSRKSSKAMSSTPSRKIDLPESIDLDQESLSQLSEEEQSRLSKLMLEYKEVEETPKKEEEILPIKEGLEIPKTSSSILHEDAISRINEIDENLRQLVPIDKWEQWSLKTSIRSITADSLLAESAPSRILDNDNTLKSLSLKNKYKKTKPRDKFLKELADKRETKSMMKEIDEKLSKMRKEHLKLQGVPTEEEKIVNIFITHLENKGRI